MLTDPLYLFDRHNSVDVCSSDLSIVSDRNCCFLFGWLVGCFCLFVVLVFNLYCFGSVSTRCGRPEVKSQVGYQLTRPCLSSSFQRATSVVVVKKRKGKKKTNHTQLDVLVIQMINQYTNYQRSEKNPTAG